MSELVPAENATQVREETNWLGYDPDMDFRKLTQEATGVAAGFKLVKKDALLGVPFVIIGATYREGMPREGMPGDYVSLECVVADQETMNRYAVAHPRRTALPQSEQAFPNEPVVFNDSSTGVRREFTKWLHDQGLIHVGEPREGSNRYDTPFQYWEEGEDIAAKGIAIIPWDEGEARPLRYVVARGLTISEYTFELPSGAKGDAETYYFG